MRPSLSKISKEYDKTGLEPDEARQEEELKKELEVKVVDTDTIPRNRLGEINDLDLKLVILNSEAPLDKIAFDTLKRKLQMEKAKIFARNKHLK